MEDKHGLYIVAIVGVVAIIALVILIIGHTTVSSDSNNAVGDSKAVAQGIFCTQQCLGGRALVQCTTICNNNPYSYGSVN